MERTREMLCLTFGKDVSTIVLEYVMAKKRDWVHVAKAGEWETCIDGPVSKNSCLRGACRGGHHELVTLMISLGADHWDHGLQDACYGGHYDLAEIMVSRGARNWIGTIYDILYWDKKTVKKYAHRKEERDAISCKMIELLARSGADDYNRYLTSACIERNRQMVAMMILYGAGQCDNHTNTHCHCPV